uniref:RING-type domain-containing protein n=1 Tax=Oryza meridionalis TaxID=40149 RepID=A0A0E0C095_9ORYZ
MQVGPTPPVAHADAAGGGARGPAGSRGVSRETGSLGPHPTPAPASQLSATARRRSLGCGRGGAELLPDPDHRPQFRRVGGAAKERPQPCVTPIEVSAFRNVRHSPSWSFRWDNRTHIEDIMEMPTLFSNHSSGSIRPETKSGSIAPTDGFSNGGSPSDMFNKLKCHKSDRKRESSKIARSDLRGRSTTSNSSPEAKLSRKSLDTVSVASDSKMSISVPSTPPAISRADPSSSSRGHSLPTDADSMRKARRSPGYQLYRQVSDSKIPSLRSLNEGASPEGRPSSSMLSVCSNDLSAVGSHGESSDGWSMRTFSEMVASSQRERWSVDSELLGSVSSKMTRSNASNNPTTHSPDQEVCKLCLKLLKERSTWNAQELAVVAVLLCGHVYHADCLDSLTAEADKYDPPCPVCTHGEKCTVKLFGKLESKTKNKIPKNVIVDVNLDGISKHQKENRREPRLGTSSSLKETPHEEELYSQARASMRELKSSRIGANDMTWLLNDLRIEGFS